MRDKPGDRIRLQHIQEAIDAITGFMEHRTMDDLYQNAMLRFAVVKQLEVIGEATSRITQTTLDLEPSIPWKEVVLMRHILVHDYYQVDVPTVWNVVANDLIPLSEAVRALIGKLPPSL